MPVVNVVPAWLEETNVTGVALVSKYTSYPVTVPPPLAHDKVIGVNAGRPVVPLAGTNVVAQDGSANVVNEIAEHAVSGPLPFLGAIFQKY